MRICLSAAEPLPREVFRRFEDTWGLPILDGIGSTEMLHIYCSNTSEARKPGSSGRPVPGYELMIRDEDGRPAAQGEVGELLVKGDSALSGYWHHRDRTRRTLIGEYFATGDRYRCDEDGFYWYEGRADDMIKVGGLWVSPIEIENVLMEYWAVIEAGVVGVEVDGFMKIRAHVIPDAGRQARQRGGGAGEGAPGALQGAPAALPVPPHRPLREGPPQDHDRQDPALRAAGSPVIANP